MMFGTDHLGRLSKWLLLLCVYSRPTLRHGTEVLKGSCEDISGVRGTNQWNISSSITRLSSRDRV